MNPRQREAFEAEMAAGHAARLEGTMDVAYAHYERAHVLGQYKVGPHVRSHWAFLKWGWKARSLREILGQLLRIVAGAIGSAIGWLPHGNTGGANVPGTRRMPVPPDLQALLDDRDPLEPSGTEVPSREVRGAEESSEQASAAEGAGARSSPDGPRPA